MEVVEFCFRPKCDYSLHDIQPAWPMDPFMLECGPPLYCPACGKPRWLAIEAERFGQEFVVDADPTGTYIYATQIYHYPYTELHAQASDVIIFLKDKAGREVAYIWDIRVQGEMSMREQFHLELPDACTFGPLTPCEAMVCAVCGAMPTNPGELTVIKTKVAPVWVCRHGHFWGRPVHAFQNIPIEMSGPKMVEILEWTPELVVHKWKHLWWYMPKVLSTWCS